jgi:hypothetical protein
LIQISISWTKRRWLTLLQRDFRGLVGINFRVQIPKTKSPPFFWEERKKKVSLNFKRFFCQSRYMNSFLSTTFCPFNDNSFYNLSVKVSRWILFPTCNTFFFNARYVRTRTYVDSGFFSTCTSLTLVWILIHSFSKNLCKCKTRSITLLRLSISAKLFKNSI